MPDVEINMSAAEFVAYTYFAGTKSGKKYLYESGKLAKSYAAKQLRLTGRMFLVDLPKEAARTAVGKAAKSSVVRASPPVAALVVGGLIFNAIGNTHAVQTAGHISNPGVMGMGGTL